MEIKINPAPPEIMHIDLNSAFAMTEQQANSLLRGRPVGITNRLNDYAICITSSYEARRFGVTIGTRYRDARRMAPRFVMLESDAPKYKYVHNQLQDIFKSYAPHAQMKSIDEGIIDFTGMKVLLKGRTLEDIGGEIKQRIREEVGDYMTVNIGIAQNRWLAKVAAGYMKPNGLTVIGPHDVEMVYALTERLTDLPYIAMRNQIRLNNAGIYTASEFFRASENVLVKQVFKSINGHHWYLKLRGYETEVEYGIKSVGRSYVLEYRTADPVEMATLLYKAASKVARRLRQNCLAARGLFLALTYVSSPGLHPNALKRPHFAWWERHMYAVPVYRSDQLYRRAMELYSHSPPGETVASLAITAYAVEAARYNQEELFGGAYRRGERLEAAMNLINDRYGELKLMPASVMASKNPMKDKLAFGSLRYFSG